MIRQDHNLQPKDTHHTALSSSLARPVCITLRFTWSGTDTHIQTVVAILAPE
jgi:hypothetical protein